MSVFSGCFFLRKYMLKPFRRTCSCIHADLFYYELMMNQRNCFSSQCRNNIAWSIDFKVHGMFREILKGGPVCF